MWIPGWEQRYNETLGPKVVFALASEYMNFSVPSSAKFVGTYPRDEVFHDVISDSLLVILRLQNYASQIESYYDTVSHLNEKIKP
jgi:hypothetical protein